MRCKQISDNGLWPIPAGHSSENPRSQGPRTGSRGGGPPCPLRWISVRKYESQWAAKEPGSANNPPLGIRTQPPDIGSALACIRSFATPWGEQVPEGGMRGQPAWSERLVSDPDKPPFLFALTPTLSHSHPGCASRESSCGRGGDMRRCRPLATDRIHQPTQGRWGLGRPLARCGSP